MRKITLDEVKELELDMLLQFHKLCEDNHLYYTLCGGSLLGAIRHKGFIPWDDDIDVLMPRPDYERLLYNKNVNKKTIKNHVKIVSWKNDDSDMPFIKLVDTRTQIDNEYMDNDKTNKIWIDVFPIDGNPADEKKLKKVYKNSLFLREILRRKRAKFGKGKTVFRAILKSIFIIMIKPISVKKICDAIDKNAKKYEFSECEYIGGILWGYGTQERINKNEFLTPIKVEFEGKMFNAPSNYDEYLSGLYGNYMELPPEDKRVSHEIIAYIED
ncbi:MAG: LicD family protein [Lachnospiraceae bacterium]|nr:LicD family protein [Lachnospiraceae bacterium]